MAGRRHALEAPRLLGGRAEVPPAPLQPTVLSCLPQGVLADRPLWPQPGAGSLGRNSVA